MKELLELLERYKKEGVVIDDIYRKEFDRNPFWLH
jgi:hypothetical protein